MPQLAAFPKAFVDAMCVDGTMSIRQWIELAGTLDIDGLEFYAGFLELRWEPAWAESRKIAADQGLSIPMLCCSPDFTHPDPAFRRHQVEQEKRWIEMAAGLGAKYCRVLSGQRRPEVGRDEGIRYAADAIHACLEHAARSGITLTIENHYKDNYWKYPEFAQRMEVFCDLIGRIAAPNFGVNYDPSNALLCGEDPLELLRQVKHRVLTMHASDRFLAEGTIDDLHREQNVEGYARRLRHGEIGRGMNDYDAIFSELSRAGFNGWISIEDGIEGLEQLRRSAEYLRTRIRRHWPQQS